MAGTFFDLVGGLRKKYDAVFALLLPVWLAVAWIAGTSLLSLWFEARQQLTAAGLIEAVPASELAVVALDEVFAEHYDYPEETPKAYLAEVIRTVAAQEPRVVVLDYWFTDADRTAPGFDALVRAVAEAPATVQFVFPTRLLPRTGGPLLLDVPPALLRRHVLTGYADLQGDPVLEHRLGTRLGSGEVAPSLALSALAAWTFPEVVGEAQGFVTASADSGAAALPLETWQAVGELLAEDRAPDGAGGWEAVLATYGLDESGVYGINHRDHFKAGSDGVLGSEDLLRGALPPPVLRSLMHDRLVVIGSTYPLETDTFTTPFGARRGALVHAATLHSVLAERPIRQSGWGLGVVAALLAALGAMVLVWMLPPRAVVGVAVGAAAAYLLLHFGLFVVMDRLLPLAWPLVGGVAGLHLAHRSWVVKRVCREGDPVRLALRLTPMGAGPWALGTGFRVSVHDATGSEQPTELTRLDPDQAVRIERSRGAKAKPATETVALRDGLRLLQRGATDNAARHAVGAVLFGALLPEAVAPVYRAAHGQATRRLGVRRPLHLDLHIADPALAAVPWAAAFDAKAGATLAALPGVRVVLHVEATPGAPTATRPFETLHLWQPVARADYDRARCEAALRAVPGLLVRPFEEAEPGRVHAVHLLGHSAETDGQPAWMFNPDRRASVQAVASRLRERGVLRVLALDSVRPAADPADTAALCLAAELTAALGMPVVVLPASVADIARGAFWRCFYAAIQTRPIVQADAIADAFERARCALMEDEPTLALACCVLPTSPR
ncbi:MAG: CHASE2 domain-containing protein [Bacteroidota bacterium]